MLKEERKLNNMRREELLRGLIQIFVWLLVRTLGCDIWKEISNEEKKSARKKLSAKKKKTVDFLRV